MPRAEALLWQAVRHRGLGAPFRRQMPIGPYFADFACPSARLVVEIDGRAHEDAERIASDQTRDIFLERQGWTVLRFTDQAVLDAPERALAEIKAALAQRRPF